MTAPFCSDPKCRRCTGKRLLRAISSSFNGKEKDDHHHQDSLERKPSGTYGHGPLNMCSEKEKDDDHDQDSLKEDLLHIWSWSSDKSFSFNEEGMSRFKRQYDCRSGLRRETMCWQAEANTGTQKPLVRTSQLSGIAADFTGGCHDPLKTLTSLNNLEVAKRTK